MDKGLINSGAVNWAQAGASKMMALQIPVLLSVNEGQFSFYKNIFPENQLVTDDASIDASGPLLGLLSMHVKYPLEDLFILACDMPLMETSVLEHLLSCFPVRAFVLRGIPIQSLYLSVQDRGIRN